MKNTSANARLALMLVIFSHLKDRSLNLGQVWWTRRNKDEVLGHLVGTENSLAVVDDMNPKGLQTINQFG